MGYYDNSVPIIDAPATRVRLFPWMIWLTDSGLWRPIQNASAPPPSSTATGAGRYNPAAVAQAGLGLQGSVSWYCDNCGAGFRDPWAQPAEPSRHLPAGGGPYILYPPDPDAAKHRPCNDDDGNNEILTTSIRWELFRKGLEDVERFYLLQRLLLSRRRRQQQQRQDGNVQGSTGTAVPPPPPGCDGILPEVNSLIWDFPTMKQRPWSDGWAPPGWSVAQEDATFSTNVTAVARLLAQVAACIEGLSSSSNSSATSQPP
eukprot:SAG31_NODE_187_length_20848_cov_22.521953_25_plen_259_part_00